MALFLILAPFVTFATLMMLTTAKVSLVAGAAAALGLVGWDLFKGRSLKILSLGAAILFVSLSAYHILIQSKLAPTTVRLAVDSGVVAIALVSIVLRKPFTLQYALEKVDAATASTPRFLRVNYILTGVWSAAFVLMLIADLASLYMPSTPLWIYAGITFAARNSATYFTQWYPKHIRAEIAAHANSAPV